MSKFQDPALRWAHRHDPHTAVKVWWHGLGAIPLASISTSSSDRELTAHRQDGSCPIDSRYDLVPLQEPLLECWVNTRPSGTMRFFTAESRARQYAYDDENRVAVKMREVRDE